MRDCVSSKVQQPGLRALVMWRDRLASACLQFEQFAKDGGSVAEPVDAGR